MTWHTINLFPPFRASFCGVFSVSLGLVMRVGKQAASRDAPNHLGTPEQRAERKRKVMLTSFFFLPACLALQTMLSMLTDPVLSDVCLVVEGVDVPCHKAVLGEDVDPA